jgi:hypothetical protein
MRNATRPAALVAALLLTLTAAPAWAGEEPDPWTFEECAQELGDVRSAAIADNARLTAALHDANQLASARYVQITELERTVRNQGETITHLTALAESQAKTIKRLRAKLAAR